MRFKYHESHSCEVSSLSSSRKSCRLGNCASVRRQGSEGPIKSFGDRKGARKADSPVNSHKIVILCTSDRLFNAQLDLPKSIVHLAV